VLRADCGEVELGVTDALRASLESGREGLLAERAQHSIAVAIAR